VGENLSDLIQNFLNSGFIVTLVVLSFLFHALNGIRILVLDLSPFTDEKKLSILVLIIFLLISAFYLVGL